MSYTVLARKYRPQRFEDLVEQQGAGSTALATRAIEVERASAPAQLRWSRFALALPRVGAAHIGRETAPRVSCITCRRSRHRPGD